MDLIPGLLMRLKKAGLSDVGITNSDGSMKGLSLNLGDHLTSEQQKDAQSILDSAKSDPESLILESRREVFKRDITAAKLLDILIEQKIITQDQIDEALNS